MNLRFKPLSLLPLLLVVVFVALAWYRLVVLNSDVLYLAQDLSLWMPGALFWHECLELPGGWLCWVGRFLTQFFYYPALGASLLIALWLLIYALLYRGLKLPRVFCWVALLPSLLLLFSVTSLGYAIYMQNVGDWWFAPTLLVLLFACVVWLFGFLSRILHLNRWLRVGAQALALVVLVFVAQDWAHDTRLTTSFFRPFHTMAGDSNYHSEIRMARAADECRWLDVVKEYRRNETAPTRTMWMLYNVALLNRKQLPTEMLHNAVITQLPTPTDSVCASMAVGFGPLLYFLHGQVNFSYRWAMENSVNYGMTAQRLRHLTQCALLLGEKELARKYLDCLSSTLFHSAWAEEQRVFLDHPELLAKNERYALPAALFAASPEDVLDGDEDLVERYLVRLFSRMDSSHDASLNELALFYALVSHDIPCFWKQFSVYAQLHAGQPMPAICQEAALLYSQLQPGLVDVSNLPFSDEVVARFYAFMQQAMPLFEQGISNVQVAQQTRPGFGHTLFWYYYFANDMQIY